MCQDGGNRTPHVDRLPVYYPHILAQAPPGVRSGAARTLLAVPVALTFPPSPRGRVDRLTFTKLRVCGLLLVLMEVGAPPLYAYAQLSQRNFRYSLTQYVNEHNNENTCGAHVGIEPT
jgi:hypothetical protein